MKSVVILLMSFLSFNALAVNNNKYFIGSSAFMLANLNEEDEYPPNFYQLNLGARLTKNSSISIEFINWNYYAPLGIPWGVDHGNDENNFPGKIESKGVGLAYQYIFDNNFYTALHATYFEQTYKDQNGETLEKGNQLFMTFRLGYQMRFFNNFFFLEPSLAITHWPTNTNLPESFQIEEDKWNNYFLFEPGLHFGFNF